MEYNDFLNMENAFIIKQIIKACEIYDETKIEFCIKKLIKIKVTIQYRIDKLNIKEKKYLNDIEIILNGTLFFFIYIKYFNKLRYKLLIETFRKSTYSKNLFKKHLKNHYLFFKNNIIKFQDLFVSDDKELLLPFTIYIHFIKTFHIYEFKIGNENQYGIVIAKHLRSNFVTRVITKTKINDYYMNIFMSKYRLFFDVLVNIIYEKILFIDLFSQ